jgi:hypothetical protein
MELSTIGYNFEAFEVLPEIAVALLTKRNWFEIFQFVSYRVFRIVTSQAYTMGFHKNFNASVSQISPLFRFKIFQNRKNVRQHITTVCG